MFRSAGRVEKSLSNFIRAHLFGQQYAEGLKKGRDDGDDGDKVHLAEEKSLFCELFK